MKCVVLQEVIFLFDGPVPDPIHHSYPTNTLYPGNVFYLTENENEVLYKGEIYSWEPRDYKFGVDYDTIMVKIT